MKKSNIITVPTLSEHIDQLARQAASGTLKRVHVASGNDMIRQLRASLQADFSAIDNNKPKYILSDAYDLYTLAYEYLYEHIAVKGLTRDTIILKILKNGKEKSRTVYQWACIEVRKEIYANKALDASGKYIYIEDMRQGTETAESVLDRQYIRTGLYEDVNHYADYIGINEMLSTLDLTNYQMDIIHKRMQGMTMDAIGEKLGVSKVAIHKQLERIKGKAAGLFPEALRHYKVSKSKKADEIQFLQSMMKPSF